MSRFATISRRNLIMPWKMLALAVLLLGFGNHALAGVIWNLNATFTDGMTASGVFVTDDSMDFTSWDVFFAGGTLVLGYLPHLGHAEAAGPHRARFHRVRHGVLEQRHRRMAIPAGRASSRTSAAAGWFRCARQYRRL